MEDLTERTNILHSTAAYEIKERFDALGIYLFDEALASKTQAYLEAIRDNLNNVQYFAAKELAWESIT